MKVEFASDNARLGKTLYALANSPLNPEFRISCTVKDPEAAKNELLGKAVPSDIIFTPLVFHCTCGKDIMLYDLIQYSKNNGHYL